MEERGRWEALMGESRKARVEETAIETENEETWSKEGR